ncbi:nitroreductase family protein [Granulosicoccus sp. 3-233]|uniref:nitroreductase family protein n=1 Tax=Granulosicoccus sp. 3-233 TaxID=3417969 RepID=UPI003D3361CC
MNQEKGESMQAESEIVDRVIRSRHTRKVMLSPDSLSEAAAVWTSEHEQALRTMIEGAAWAPFHRRAHEATHRQGALDSVVPWRFHVLDKPACLALLNHLQMQAESDADPRWARAWQSKIKNMLSACGALVQATWLPDPAETGDEPQLTDNNVEHIAATGAAIQNLLLAAEARGWRSYWSSGGILRDPQVFEYLGIGARESLLGSVFLTPVEAEGVTLIHGGLRDQRGETGSWSRWVQLP